ncbi:MAG: aminoacyl-histidine dipeptidase [Lachnospiraceae bacterium]|nr:aminoacyl-histidine dipeptidase [Lachnospiraceae bacterium]
MAVLEHLKPQKVFYFFEQLCGIPHGSGNVEQISNYLVDFAKERGFEYIQDEVKNVIIIKEASVGYENVPALMIQGHMDMVAVKEADCQIDMAKEGLQLRIDGDLISAEGTSLGGDDGIAVAYALALLDDDSISHPRLEVVLTVDEETGMEGASAIDLSMLQAKRMLNIDSEEEGILLTGCAGGVRAACKLPLRRCAKTGLAYKVTITGLQGGHSGIEIHKERGNSNCLMGRMLYCLLDRISYDILDIAGGVADNAVPANTSAMIVIEEKDAEAFEAFAMEYEAVLQKELQTKDPGVRIEYDKMVVETYQVLTKETKEKAVRMLFMAPNGVQAMNADIPGLVQTSLNLGILSMQEAEMILDYSVRSSVTSEKKWLVSRLSALTETFGGSLALSGDYPAWEFRKDSALLQVMVEIYEAMYGKKPEVQTVHAGMECGILSEKIDNLDCVSFGPDMKDIHTPKEVLSISSTQRVWEYLVEVVKRK